MTLAQHETHTAALNVVRHKLARGVSHVEIDMILNGEPGSRHYSVEELGQVRDVVNRMFRDYIESITPEAVA